MCMSVLRTSWYELKKIAIYIIHRLLCSSLFINMLHAIQEINMYTGPDSRYKVSTTGILKWIIIYILLLADFENYP